MTKRGRATIYVQPVLRNSQFLRGYHGNYRKGFVHFKQIDVVHRPPRLLQNLADRGHRRRGKKDGLPCMSGMCNNLGHNGQVQLLCHARRSEEHTSELQSLMSISYAVFCLKKKKSTLIRSNIKRK